MSIFHSFVPLLLLPAVKFSCGVTVWTVQSPFRLKVRWHYIPFHEVNQEYEVCSGTYKGNRKESGNQD